MNKKMANYAVTTGKPQLGLEPGLSQPEAVITAQPKPQLPGQAGPSHHRSLSGLGDTIVFGGIENGPSS